MSSSPNEIVTEKSWNRIRKKEKKKHTPWDLELAHITATRRCNRQEKVCIHNKLNPICLCSGDMQRYSNNY